jgi:hypothetical protein
VEPHPQPQPPQVEPIPAQADTVPKVSAIRREVRSVFQEDDDDAWVACISEYTMQGNLFALLQAENESITWKFYMWDLPCGVLKFAVKSSIATRCPPSLTSEGGEACSGQLPALWEHGQADAVPCSGSM